MVKSIWKRNWTHHWGWFNIGIGSSAATVSIVAQVLNDGSVKSAIDSLNIDPRWMLVIAIIGVITLVSTKH